MEWIGASKVETTCARCSALASVLKCRVTKMSFPVPRHSSAENAYQIRRSACFLPCLCAIKVGACFLWPCHIRPSIEALHAFIPPVTAAAEVVMPKVSMSLAEQMLGRKRLRLSASACFSLSQCPLICLSSWTCAKSSPDLASCVGNDRMPTHDFSASKNLDLQLVLVSFLESPYIRS